MTDDRRGPTLIEDETEASAARRGPTLIEDVGDLPEAPGAAEAPAVDAPPPPAAATAMTAAARGPSLIARLFWTSLLGLLSMAVGLWFWETVEALVARNIWLGRIALAFAAVVGVTLLAMATRELAALSRLGKVDKIRDTADRARRTGDITAAKVAARGIGALYRGRPELADARAALETKTEELVDGDALIDAAERAYMQALDERAEAAVRRGARQVAAATALIPLALVDVLAALTVNLRMIREIAEIYGGRAGWLGSWRLFRAVASHLVATGAVAIGDDMLGAALGGGVVARLSRRFGEGLVNGALTARIGVAAIEVCRPLPFGVRQKPGVGALIRGAFADLGGKADAASDR